GRCGLGDRRGGRDRVAGAVGGGGEEGIAGAVVVPAGQVDRLAGERDERPARRHEGVARVALGGLAGGVGADERQGAGFDVVEEDVAGVVVVAGRQVAGAAGEGDVAALLADGRLEAHAVGAGGAELVDADQGGGAGVAVVEKNVALAVGVVAGQVAGLAAEHDEAPVLADAGAVAVAVGFGAAGPDADARGHAGLHVAHEDVALAVVVAADQVAGLGAEGDEPAVGADRGVERAGVARDVA